MGRFKSSVKELLNETQICTKTKFPMDVQVFWSPLHSSAQNLSGSIALKISNYTKLISLLLQPSQPLLKGKFNDEAAQSRVALQLKLNEYIQQFAIQRQGLPR